MIIQCRKCETRFRFDDTLMAGDGVWVRCSRCQHVFFQQRSAGDASAVEPEIPSVRISDARRNSEDRFPAAGDRLQRTETQAEAAPPTPIHAEESRKRISAGNLRSRNLVRISGRRPLPVRLPPMKKKAWKWRKRNLPQVGQGERGGAGPF